MSRLVLIIPLITCSLLQIFASNSYADRLIRRSDGEIVLLGFGTPDGKKETVLFKGCTDPDSKIFSLKEYLFQIGKDCVPPKIFSGLESIRIDGTGEPNKVESCSTGKSCLRYIVKSSEEVETVFAGARKGDRIEVTISDFDKTKSNTSTQNVDLTVRFVPEKTGQVKDILNFSKVPASGDFVNKVTVEKR
jgi:hypothetical protein